MATSKNATGCLNLSRSFAQSSFFYDGTPDYETVENFLTAARKYKCMKNIVDANALRSINFVLKGSAASWWNETKHKISTWKEFECQLRKTFAPQKPAYVVYQEISENRQRPDELTERFVAKQQALFNQLNPSLPEEVQLDMMYAFMHTKIQEQIPRDCINSIEGLLEAARAIEGEQLKEKPQPKPPIQEKKSGKKRVRCGFCRFFGHMAEDCRKKQKMLQEKPQNSEKESLETEPPKEPTSSTTSSELKDAENGKGIIGCMPRVEISIGTAKELAYVDTGATCSLASFNLYSYLKNIGFHFQEENTTITLADGVPKNRDILTGRVPVRMQDRCVLTSFIVLPECEDTKTLLGVGFIEDAGMILNLGQMTWHFIDEPNVHYDLIIEDPKE